MSRRLPNHQRRVTPPDNNFYQASNGTTHHHHYTRSSRKGAKTQPSTTIDIGFSDATTTDTYYDQYERNGFRHSPSRDTEVTFSDDGSSTRLPYYEFDDESNKRYSRTSFSDRQSRGPRSADKNHHKEQRNVYSDQEESWDRLYQEIPTPFEAAPIASNVSKRPPPSRLSDRPQSSMSSATPAIVYGCGGKCQTFENVCYFFLQLIFTMGILIGMSLCIAGLVLRNSAAKNLQVLIYIGVLLALVSALLLAIQCRSRSTARRRIKTIQMAKRAPIQMETLHVRPNIINQNSAIVRESQRMGHNKMAQIHGGRPLPQRPQHRTQPIIRL